MRVQIVAGEGTGQSRTLGRIRTAKRRHFTPLGLRAALSPASAAAFDHRNRIDEFAALCIQAGLTAEEIVDGVEKAATKIVLEEAGWNQCKAAKILGMHRNTLHRKLIEWRRQERCLSR